MKNDVTSIPDHKHQTRQLVIISLMTAIICIIAPFSVPIPMSPVPLSLTNFMIFITVYVLGIRSAAFCVILYLILGQSVSLSSPHSAGGLGKLAGPTGGYLIGFIFLALIQGLFIRLFSGIHMPLSWNDPRNDCMLYLRNGMAGLAAGAELYRIPGDWCASLFAG